MRFFYSAVLALLALGCLIPTVSAAQIAVEQVPGQVDASNQAGWWRPIVVANGTTYVAFNSPGSVAGTHEVKVGVKVGSGAWVIGSLKDETGAIWSHPDDIGHDQPTLAVDGDGYIHVFADQHVDNWRYFRSGAPNDPSAMLRRIGEMPGTVGMTYPVADTAPNGDVYLMMRNHTNGAGQGELYRFDNINNAWSKLGVFARETGNYVYPDAMAIDAVGNIHLAFEWAYGMPRPLRHYGSYLRYDVGTAQFRTVNGSAVTTPVTRTTPNLLFQGLSTGEVWNNSDTGIGIQGAAITVDNLNRPSIVYRYRTDGGSNGLDYDVYRLRWNSSAWADKVKVFTATDNVPATLVTTHTGTRARVYFTVSGTGVMGAESPNFTPSAIATGQAAVTRISGVLVSSNEDVIYASAPQEISADSGRLYVMRVGPVLP